MARFKNGINGGFTGKIGTMVGVQKDGEQYGRSLPRKTTKPVTPGLQLQRDKFTLIRKWLKPLLELINIGYKMVISHKTPMNAAISYHLKEVVVEQEGSLSIDFTKVILSRGELMVSWILEVLCLVDRLLHIKWADATANAFCSANDRAVFVVYNPSRNEFVNFENIAQRADGEVSLKLPKVFENDTVHAWMHYVNEAGDKVSTSSYLGEIVVV